MIYTLECRDESGWYDLVVAGDKLEITNEITTLTGRGVDFKSLRVRGWKYGKVARSLEGSGCGSLENYLSLIGT